MNESEMRILKQDEVACCRFENGENTGDLERGVYVVTVHQLAFRKKHGCFWLGFRNAKDSEPIFQTSTLLYPLGDERHRALSAYRLIMRGDGEPECIKPESCSIRLQKCPDYGEFISDDKKVADLIAGEYEVGADFPAGRYRISMIDKPNDVDQEDEENRSQIIIFDTCGYVDKEEIVKNVGSAIEVRLYDEYEIGVNACLARIEFLE